MKKALMALLILITVQQARAQHAQTLFSNSGTHPKIGAYGVPAAKFTSIDGKFGLLTGGYGGILFNSKLMLGAGAYSLVNNVPLPGLNADGKTDYLNLWYTGLVVEYIHNSDKLIHWTAGTLIGGGGVSRRDKFRFDDDGDHNDYNYDKSGLFVAEPFANLELNIMKYLRLDIGASYRLVTGTGTSGITDSKLSSPSIHVGLKAGVF
jgi:hypothetical protein